MNRINRRIARKEAMMTTIEHINTAISDVNFSDPNGKATFHKLLHNKDYLAQQTCIGHALVNRELRQRGDYHSLAALHGFGRIDQPVFGANHRDAVIFTRLEADESGHFLADTPVTTQVHALRLDDPGLQ